LMEFAESDNGLDIQRFISTSSHHRVYWNLRRQHSWHYSVEKKKSFLQPPPSSNLIKGWTSTSGPLVRNGIWFQ
jgi:hypothetical protein